MKKYVGIISVLRMTLDYHDYYSTLHTAVLLGGDNNGTDELNTPNSVGIFICCIRFPTGTYSSYSSPCRL